MKIKINRNTLCTELFVKELASLGLEYVCISPGSRNTPLILAFTSENKIKSFVHIDERSSAFFALGLAKASNKPAAIVCTSGTAAAELYPAIIEAYQQNVPLIICTADREPDQRGRGANQVINQDNLYKNHIRLFIDAGLPEADSVGIKRILNIAVKAYSTSIAEAGPVHINFPFSKPFEPDNFTDEIDRNILTIKPDKYPETTEENDKSEKIRGVLNKVSLKKKILFVAGPDENPKNLKTCIKAAEAKGIPLLADVFSHFRFLKSGNIITAYDALLRSAEFRRKAEADLIIQFGRTPTSKILLEYLASASAERMLVNRFGAYFDPSGKAKTIIAAEPSEFCNQLLNFSPGAQMENEWLSLFTDSEKKAGSLRKKIFSKADFDTEGRVISDLLNYIPSGSAVMISNSTPVREMDYITPVMDKKFSLFFNRGASGIDGITSTALGITASLKKPSVLVTGDLAFFYDITSLRAGHKYKIPLTVIILNNKGGGIFHSLPAAAYKKVFKEYFITPQNVDFGPLVKAFGWKYKKVRSSSELRKSLLKSVSETEPQVIEIQTDAVKSLKLRTKFRNKALKII